jgi:hypothetical protein
MENFAIPNAAHIAVAPASEPGPNAPSFGTALARGQWAPDQVRGDASISGERQWR